MDVGADGVESWVLDREEGCGVGVPVPLEVWAINVDVDRPANAVFSSQILPQCHNLLGPSI